MVQSNYSISLINFYTEDPAKDAKELYTLPVLSIEEEDGKWYFKDSIGNKAPTTKETIRNFVFGIERIKVFGAIYLYLVYYPQHKPSRKKLEELRLKLA